MEDDHIFIDKIIKKSLEGYGEQPDTSWEEMEMYLNKKSVLSETSQGFLNLKNLKTKIAIISSGVLILISGYFFLNETENLKITPKKEIIENFSDTISHHIKDVHVTKIEKRENEIDSFDKKVNKTEKKNKTKTVKVRIEVPVHKNVIIKKQIIMKDTLN